LGYQIRIVPEVEAWLAELRQGDPAVATLVDEAVDALRVAGESLGAPMVVPLDNWPSRQNPDPRQTLDYSYQRMLENLTRVRRGIADVATARKRVQLHIEQLEQQATETSRDAAPVRAEVLEQLGQLSAQRAHLEEDEQRLGVAGRRLQRKVDAFRTRKEALKAGWTAAESAGRIDREVELAEAEIEQAEAEAGPGEDIHPAGGSAEPSTGARYRSESLQLYELRPGAPGNIGARILFLLEADDAIEAEEPNEADGADLADVEAGETAVLLAAGTDVDVLRAWYREAVLLCGSRYRRGGTAG
jgi:phage shock protein A